MKTTRTRVRRTPEQWQTIFTAFESSGLDRKSFCASHDLRIETLRRAEQRLAPRRSISRPFVELSTPEYADRAVSSNWDIELDLGEGLVLRLARR